MQNLEIQFFEFHFSIFHLISNCKKQPNEKYKKVKKKRKIVSNERNKFEFLASRWFVMKCQNALIGSGTSGESGVLEG